MLFKDIPYLQLWWPYCWAEQNHLGNFGRVHYEEHLCEVILNFVKFYFKFLRNYFEFEPVFRRCCLKYLLPTATVTILFDGVEPFKQF